MLPWNGAVENLSFAAGSRRKEDPEAAVSKTTVKRRTETMMAPQGRQLQRRAPGTANLQIGQPWVLGPCVESQPLATRVIPNSRRLPVERGIPLRVPRPARSKSESAAHQKKCHSAQPFSHRIPLKTNDPCAKEVSQKTAPACQPAIRKSQIKWDSVSLNFSSKSLKTKVAPNKWDTFSRTRPRSSSRASIASRRAWRA
jgi:hypothetical protein